MKPLIALALVTSLTGCGVNGVIIPDSANDEYALYNHTGIYAGTQSTFDYHKEFVQRQAYYLQQANEASARLQLTAQDHARINAIVARSHPRSYHTYSHHIDDEDTSRNGLTRDELEEFYEEHGP